MIQRMISFLVFALAIALAPALAEAADAATTVSPSTRATLPFYAFAPTPPMGWNSYDAFGDSVTEDEVMANANYVKDKLLSHGWNYIVIDFR